MFDTFPQFAVSAYRAIITAALFMLVMVVLATPAVPSPLTDFHLFVLGANVVVLFLALAGLTLSKNDLNEMQSSPQPE